MVERDPSLRRRPVEGYAKQALQRRWKKVAKSGRHIEQLELEERHRMRRSLKKLRYMTEFFAPIYARKDVKPFVKELKKLQDIFGYVNDVRMAEQLRAIAKRGKGLDCAIAAGIVLGTHQDRAAEIWREAPEKWRRLGTRSGFWQ
jgi:CHAD domain-containing protein